MNESTPAVLPASSETTESPGTPPPESLTASAMSEADATPTAVETARSPGTDAVGPLEATGPAPAPAAPAPMETPLSAPMTRAASADPVVAAVSVAEALSMGLSPAQRTAIEKLTTGHTQIASATAAGVTRVTLHRWLKHDLTFLAAYNAWQHDAIATARARLLALTDTAVTTVQNAIVKGDGRLALTLLIRLGIADRPAPGSTDIQDLQAEASLSRQRQEIEQRKEADRVAWDGILHPPAFPEAQEEAEPEETIRVRYKRLE